MRHWLVGRGGLNSPSSVGSCFCSAQRGDGGLGSGSEVELVRSSSGHMVYGDPFPASIPSTKAAKSFQGPSSGDGALQASSG